MPKGTSQAKATLNSKKIQPVAYTSEKPPTATHQLS